LAHPKTLSRAPKLSYGTLENIAIKLDGVRPAAPPSQASRISKIGNCDNCHSGVNPGGIQSAATS